MPRLSLGEVSVHGFRGLRKLELKGLGRINLLVGENNSGKTSVLEALSILCNPYEPYEWLSMIRRRDFGGLDETRIQSLRWCFQQTGELIDADVMFRGQCQLSCEGAFPLRTLRVEYRDIVGEPDSKEMERLAHQRGGLTDEVEFDETWRGAQITHFIETDGGYSRTTGPDSSLRVHHQPIDVRLWENDRMMGRLVRPRSKGNLATDTLTPYSYQLNRLQVRSQSRQLFSSESSLEKGRGLVLDLMREFDPDIEDIKIASFRGARPAIYVSHKKLGPAPLSVFGDALRRSVLLASTLHMLRGGGVLLIDEVETGIHVSALARIFRWLANAARDLDVQIVATTHSLEAVDAIATSVEERVGDLATFHLEQTPDETRAKRIAGELLVRLRRERGLDVR